LNGSAILKNKKFKLKVKIVGLILPLFYFSFEISPLVLYLIKTGMIFRTISIKRLFLTRIPVC
jgi:hypothetical protein